MNNSTVSVAAPTGMDLTNHYTYIGCGLSAVVANIVVVVVIFRSKLLLRKSAFAVGLSFGDIINGLALLITGFKRIQFVKQGIYSALVHPIECLKGFTTLWLIGTQIPVVMMLVIGMERVMAVAFFTWYYKRWSNKIAWILTCVVYVYVCGSIGTIWMIISNLPENSTATRTCGTPTVIGYGYSMYNYGLAIVCGCIAITTTIVSLVITLKEKRRLQIVQQNNINMQRFFNKQWPITTSMACIAIFDFFMVVIPNVLLLMINFVQFPPEIKSIGAWSADLICSRSALSLIIYIIFNRDFRLSFLSWIGIKNHILIHPNVQMSILKISPKYQVAVI